MYNNVLVFLYSKARPTFCTVQDVFYIQRKVKRVKKRRLRGTTLNCELYFKSILETFLLFLLEEYKSFTFQNVVVSVIEEILLVNMHIYRQVVGKGVCLARIVCVTVRGLLRRVEKWGNTA